MFEISEEAGMFLAAQMKWGKPARATLIKKVTDDGICDILDSVPIGKTYIVFPGSIRVLSWGRVGTDKIVQRPSIFVLSEDPTWMPCELLDLEHATIIQ